MLLKVIIFLKKIHRIDFEIGSIINNVEKVIDEKRKTIITYDSLIG